VLHFTLPTHTSHFTPHTSHLTPHTSHLTPHTLHVTSQNCLEFCPQTHVFEARCPRPSPSLPQPARFDKCCRLRAAVKYRSILQRRVCEELVRCMWMMGSCPISLDSGQAADRTGKSCGPCRIAMCCHPLHLSFPRCALIRVLLQVPGLDRQDSQIRRHGMRAGSGRTAHNPHTCRRQRICLSGKRKPRVIWVWADAAYGSVDGVLF
jgi:hypothetical protein